MEFETKLESLDIDLLGAIPSQTTAEDKRSLLALHLACRRRNRPFRWLEVGSYLGGSLQALIMDPACTAIESIDSRPDQMPDDRIATMAYPENSTERMLRLLRELPEADMNKLRTHDAQTSQLDPQAFERPDLCFIDAEHTDEACSRDAEFCRRVLRDEGVIVFHDVGIVYRAVASFLETLRAAGTPYRVAYLPDVIFAVELGRGALLSDPVIGDRQLAAGEGVLSMLCANDRYRAVLTARRGRLLRKLGLLRVDETLVAETSSELRRTTIRRRGR